MRKYAVAVACCDCQTPCTLKQALKLGARLAEEQAAKNGLAPSEAGLTTKLTEAGGRQTERCDVHFRITDA